MPRSNWCQKASARRARNSPTDQDASYARQRGWVESRRMSGLAEA